MASTEELTTGFLAGRHTLFAFIYGFVKNPHDAEDIFQEVWVRFSRAVSSGVEIAEPQKWCRGTARNLILHYWRDRRGEKLVGDEELLDLVELSFAEQDGNQEYWRLRQEALTECVKELPARSRELLQLKYEEDLSAEAVGDKLALSAAAVWMSLSRVRKLLRECAERKLRPVQP